MGRISAFVFITLEGCYKGSDDDISWHNHGEEELKYSEESLASGDTLLFGRMTYEMMKNFWPTPTAAELMPKVAEGMNNASKLVVSNTLTSSDWDNTKVLGRDWLSELREIKKLRNITVLGSGSILTQLSNASLLDHLEVMINPKAIGKGTSIFQGLDNQIDFRLESHRVLTSGIILLKYLVGSNK
ncbi:MAG: dihydrofolate reductase family protein [Cyclobacteriaceae bacterium]